MNKTGKNGEQNRPPVVTKTTVTPNGIIRKGQRKPVNKPDALEREDRIQELAEFIMEHPFASRKKISDKFCRPWNASWKTIEWSYVEPARRRVTILSRMSQKEAREKALGVVMKLMDHKSPEIVLRAVTAFSRITGIEMSRVEVSGVGGGPVQLQASRPLADMSTDDLRKLADTALKKLEARNQ